MNELYSHHGQYRQRWITQQLRSALLSHPVVVLTGARQVGKSTLLRQAEPFRSWPYRTLDDHDVLRQALEHPRSLWAGEQTMVLDEVQRAPQLLLAIKQAVDEDRSRRFLLSGSANLVLMEQVSESLAGRGGRSGAHGGFHVLRVRQADGGRQAGFLDGDGRRDEWVTVP